MDDQWINDEAKFEVTNGSMMTRVVGPQPDDGGKYWIIDGRDEEVPAGTAPQLSKLGPWL